MSRRSETEQIDTTRGSAGTSRADEHRQPLPIGHVVDGYRLVEVLGRGGFAITYLAVEDSLGRKVALKEYLPRGIAWRAKDGLQVCAAGPGREDDYSFCLDCFRREAEALLQFRHPSIVPVLRYFEANNTAYMVLDYEPGASLASILAQVGHVEEAWLASILFPLLDGLETIHAKNFYHRDIKPSNIYIRADGSPVLLDFGSARKELAEMSLDLSVILTPVFAPPEQYSGGAPQGPWTDIYALGITLYVAATGLKPPDAAERKTAISGGRRDPLVPAVETRASGFSRRFLSAVDAGIALEPTERPQSIADWRPLFGPPPEEAEVRQAIARMAAAGATTTGPFARAPSSQSQVTTRRD